MYLQRDFEMEYKAYDLVTLSIAVVLPMVKKYFTGWQPLSDPKFGIDIMAKWKGEGPGVPGLICYLSF